MTPRDRTIPAATDVAPKSHVSVRFLVDLGAILTIIGLVFSSGIAWKTFLDDGKRLDQHDTEIQQLTQIEQQQQTTMAALSQNVADIKDRLPPPEGR